MAVSLSLGIDESSIHTIEHGNFSYICNHPEAIVGNPKVSSLFQSGSLRKKEPYIVVDEAYCAIEWGMEFRPLYRKLYQLRAVIPNARWLALSATLSVKGQGDVIKYLQLRDCKVFAESAILIAENISISVKQRPSNSTGVQAAYRFIFDAIFNELKSKLNETPMTIIYFSSSLNWIGFAYELAHTILGEDFSINGNPRVCMYHSSIEKDGEELRDCIYQQMSVKASPLRVVIASSALGIGTDLGLVQRIVHAGPPKSIEAYVQQIGRVGRRGSQASAIVFFNKSDLCRPEMASEMRSFCKENKTCRRMFLNNYFSFSCSTEYLTCCDICNPSLSE